MLGAYRRQTLGQEGKWHHAALGLCSSLILVCDLLFPLPPPFQPWLYLNGLRHLRKILGEHSIGTSIFWYSDMS